MAEWKAYHFRTPSLNGSVAHQFYTALRAFMLAQGWELHDSWGAQTAQYTFSGSNYMQNNETVTLDGKVYTFKTATPTVEGEILIGANFAASMDNLKLAVNRTDPGTNDGVKYKIAEAHPNWEATTNTDTSQAIAWKAGAGNCPGNIAVMVDTAVYAGWTALQVWGTDPITVWKSRGESSLEPYGYVLLTIEPTVLRIDAYQYWDAGTHTGTRRNYRPADYFYLNQFSVSYDCIIAGDKDMIYATCRAVGGDTVTAWAIAFGHMPKRFFPDLIATTDAIVAGSNVSIPVTDSSKVPGAGGYFQILGLSEGCDKLQVASIPDSTHVVVATLPRNYASGATIGFPASTFFIIGSYSNSGLNTPCPTAHFADAGLTVGTGRHSFANIDMRTLSAFYGKQLMTPYFFLANGQAAIGWIDKGVFFHTAVTAWDVGCVNNDGSIITTNILATSGGNLTITDSTKSWTPDAFIGKFIVLVGGTGIGQVRKITDNDGTTLTIGYAWYINPDATTTFRIYDTVYRYQPQFPFTASGILVTHTEMPS